MKKDIEIDVAEVTVNPGTGRSIVLSFEAEDSAVLNCFTLAEVINHFGKGDLLDEIGEAAARDHFGIEEGEENE